MKERAFNLFYFAKAGFIEELGVVVHHLGGTDAEKEHCCNPWSRQTTSSASVSLSLEERVHLERNFQCR